MDMWCIKSLALQCFGVLSWKCERGHLWREAIVCTPARGNANLWRALHLWEKRTAYWVVSDFSMFLLPITGLQLLDSHKLMVLHLASGCTTSLLSTIPENLFILICPSVFINSDFWVRKPSCYQLSQSCF